jgi:hypothetical protein
MQPDVLFQVAFFISSAKRGFQRQPHPFVQSEQQVHAVHGSAGCSLYQRVNSH